VQDKAGLTSHPATVTVNYQNTAPLANPDTVTGTVGMPIVIDVLGNDVDSENNINPATVQIVGIAGAGQPLVVAGQGTWLVNPNTGAITFSPQPGFTGSPDPISYTVQDKTGLTSNPATVTVNYPQIPMIATNDVVTGTKGQPVTVNVLGNDAAFGASSVQILGTISAGQSLIVPNQGVWNIDASTGSITFNPQVGFDSEPDPIRYIVKNAQGISHPATVTVQYPLPNIYNASQLGEVSVVFSDSTAHHIEKVFLRGMEIVPYTYELSPLYEVKFLSTWDPKLNPISLAGELKDQFATNGILLYSISDKFKHTDPSVPLKFEAALPNGKALPAFVVFDGKTGEFKFNADLAKSQKVNSIVIRVVAEDNRGNQTSSSFQTRFNQDGSYKTRDLNTVDYRTSELKPLRLVGMLEHQFILKGMRRYEIGGAFEHSNPNEKLIFTTTLHDGSALPNFVRFDSETKSFSFDSEEAHQKHVNKLIIKVVVKDAQNNSVSTSFEVNFNQSEETNVLMQQLLNEKLVQADLAGFAIEQGNDADGFMGLLEALFDNAMQAPDTTKTDNTPATSDALHARHNLTEQVKTAGFFGYQQNKSQLVADLSQLFTKS